MTDAEILAGSEAARRVNAQRDRLDRERGLATPHDAGMLEVMQTVICALEAGLRCGDPKCVFEALDMLREAAGPPRGTNGSNK
jgi:hypothetical protein